MAIEEDSATHDAGSAIELDDEMDGEEVGSRNYRFCKIGEPVPLLSSTATRDFDIESLPVQPLAVSERFRLLFVAHPNGFCVARTKDVMAAAEDIKEEKTGSSVQELSLVDVSVGKVSILALSHDESLLAATVASHVHVFAVSALLHKEQKPSYSVSVDDSSYIKDMRWSRKIMKEYVVLSANGKLYHGSGQGPPSYALESVDSADWSTEGDFIAVARKNAVSILSSRFKEKISFLLPFQSLIGGSQVSQVMKVDSIRWIRPDCIVVGCFLLNDDGGEENYVVQVVSSRGRRITDVNAASKPIVLSFNNVFLDFCPDVVPTTHGQHLFLSYLDLHGLAFIANRNLSRQVGLLCWSLDNQKNEPTMVEILDDAWSLYIDSQENGEENLILGLSVDKVAQNENVKLTLGDEETEVTPCCVIICMTIDGKVSVFHFASAVEASVPSRTTSEEGEGVHQASSKHELQWISSKGSEEPREQAFLKSESYARNNTLIEKTGVDATVTNGLTPSLHVNSRPEEQIATVSTGHKSLANLPVVKVDDLEKTLPTVTSEDSKAVKQSIPDVRSSASFFSGKVMGEFSSQPAGNYPLSDCSLEPSSKVPSTNSSGTSSLTFSKGRVDASKAFGAECLPLLPNEVKNSDKCELHLTKPMEKGEPTVTALGNRNSLQAFPVLQTPLVDSVSSGKSFKSELKTKSDAASCSTLPYPTQIARKQFGNVEEMAKKLDALLEDIEGKGGFRDASITSLESCFLELEDGTWALSNRCRTWKGLLDEQLKKVLLLLDKTVQVLVRKVYMEGIFKQATDSRYWELWNRQKLSSELELKQKRVSDLNQELTNQLIELERHFNSLEFHKFGENGGIQRNQRVVQNWHGHSRKPQSFHSLHNTMNAQLAAAEQLSGCLSEQMAALRIESSGKRDAKKQIFESIGLSYVGDCHRSRDGDMSFGTPSNSEKLITSYPIATKENTRRNQVSFAKSYESETARRRRDSLDRSWANFEPPKTTVKRMLLKEDYEKGSADRSLLNIDRQPSIPWLQKISGVPHSALVNTPGVSLNRYNSKGTTETVAKLPTESPSSSFNGKNDSFAANESKFVQQSDTSFQHTPSISRWSPDQSLKAPSDSTETLDHLNIEFTKSTKDQTSIQVVTQRASLESIIPRASGTAFSPGLSLSEKGLFPKVTDKPSQLHDGVSATGPSQATFGSSLLSSNTLPSLSSLVSKPSTPSLALSSPSWSGTSEAVKQDVSQPQTSVLSAMNVPSILPSSTPQSNLLSLHASSTITKSELPTPLSHPPMTMNGSRTESISQRQTSGANMPSTTENHVNAMSSASLPGLAVSTFNMKLGRSASSASTESSTTSKSGPQNDFGGSENSIATSTIKSEQPQAAEVLSPIAVLSDGIVGSAKNLISDGSPEEEMEEEAPETDQATEFALNNLGEFGIGSTPSSNMSKPNPFGVSIPNKESVFATSPFTRSAPTGELFRPASFSFQSPQPPEQLQPTTAGTLSGGFGTGYPAQVSAASGFGQPARIGAGQQALVSGLGAFGQSRQLGTGLTGSSVPPTSGFGGGLMGVSAGGFGGGFASASTGGGFASLAAGGGGFAAAGSVGGGFSAAAAAGGGFAAVASGGGFTSSATAGAVGSGGGFGAFSSQQGSGGFSGFGGSSGTVRPPSELFTQMRK